MKVVLPEPLLSYTDRQRVVEAEGDTLADLLWDLDRMYPGIRNRMIDEQGQTRPNIRLFLNANQTLDLNAPLEGISEVMIFQALRGG